MKIINTLWFNDVKERSSTWCCLVDDSLSVVGVLQFALDRRHCGKYKEIEEDSSLSWSLCVYYCGVVEGRNELKTLKRCTFFHFVQCLVLWT